MNIKRICITLFAGIMLLVGSCNLMDKQPLVSNDIDTLLNYKYDSTFMADYILREKLKDIEEMARLKIDSLRQACRDDALGLNNKYHIIVGSFKISKNAGSYLTSLHMMGYNPNIIELKNGYNLVSAASYTHYDSAAKALSTLRQSLTPNAWIYMRDN